MDQRQGFLVSAVVHMVILTILSSSPFEKSAPMPEQGAERPRETARVILPPPEVLRELITPVPPPPPPTAPPAATPAPTQPKDRISVGPPSSLRAQGPLLLRRDEDLTTRAPKGLPDAVPSPAPQVAQNEPGRPGAEAAPEPSPVGSSEFAWRPDSERRADEGGGDGRSIISSLREIDRHLDRVGSTGSRTGTGQQMGPLFFDPRGADFTAWINHFKNEVYRNWIVPQSAMLGYRPGHVDFEFTVQRDGRLTNLRMVKSSGTDSLDRAAQNALLGSRLRALPPDFGPPEVAMQVTFYYNEGPQTS